MPDYTLRQLEYFVAVAEAGSVTRAAASVHLSQSAMSAALADLENALSVQLLVRHHARGISLTPAGGNCSSRVVGCWRRRPICGRPHRDWEPP